MGRLQIVVAVSAGLWIAATAQAQRCGDGNVDPLEDCDQGGFCVGGDNAGTPCTAESQCHGDGVCAGGLKTGWACGDDTDCTFGHCVHCKTFSANGCAANCTFEVDLPFPLVPGVVDGLDLRRGTSGFQIKSAFNIGIPTSGTFHLRLGKLVDGMRPVTMAESVLPAANVGGLACACSRLVAARTCGGTVFERDGSTRSLDCTADSSVCPPQKPCAFVHGTGNAASGTIGCGVLGGTDVVLDQPCPLYQGPEPFALTGHAGPGSAQILVSLALVTASGSCSQRQFGADGMLCTADDPPAVRGVPEAIALVTGSATGRLGAGEQQIAAAASGAPFLCQALSELTPAASGTDLVGVTVGSRPLGGLVFGSFAAAPGPLNSPPPTPAGPTLTPVPNKPTCTPTPTFTITSTRTPTVPMSPSSTPSITPTVNPSSTPTPVPSATPSLAPSATATDTPLPSATWTLTPTATESPTPVPSASATVTPTPSTTASPSPTESPTVLATHTATAAPTATPTAPAQPPCVGDCSNDTEVTVDEIITMVNVALDTAPLSTCVAGDQNGDGSIAINEIIIAVNKALGGCLSS